MHRDFKPENVLVGSDGRARVLTSASRAPRSTARAIEDALQQTEPEGDVDRSLTRTGSLLGTPAYMAPEQLRREPVDARSDQFSYCVTLFEALFGRRPFDGDTLAQLAADLGRGVPVEIDRGETPAAVLRVLVRGLAVVPSDRFASMTALLGELEAGARPVRSRIAWVLPAVALGAIGIGALAMRDRDDPPTDALAEVADDGWAELVAASQLPEPLATPLPDDPLAVTVHRLRNGLTIYVSTRRDTPHVAAWTVARCGTRAEPSDAKGVAHLLEHLMFKGTSRIGTMDWAAEKGVLTQLSAWTDILAGTSNPAARAAALQRIAELEQEGARYALPKEHMEVLQQLGVSKFNGATQQHSLTFMADVPSQHFDAWLELEAERLRDPVFRGFFPELGVVAQELNSRMGPDVALFNAAFDALFVGTGEVAMAGGNPQHLARPLLREAKAFHAACFLPNNIALVLVGDIDAAQAVAKADSVFGDWAPGPVAAVPELAPLPPGRTAVESGGTAPIDIALEWRHDAVTWHDAFATDALLRLVHDGGARGRLVESKIASFAIAARTGPYVMIAGLPTAASSAAEFEASVLDSLGAFARGEIDDAGLRRVRAGLELDLRQSLRDPMHAALILGEAFARGQAWPDVVDDWRAVAELSATDVAAAAQTLLDQGFVVATRTSAEPVLSRFELPTIGAIEYAPGRRSRRAADILAAPTTPLEPQFLVEGRHYTIAQAHGALTIRSQVDDGLFTLALWFPVGLLDDTWVCEAVDLWTRTEAVERWRAAGIDVESSCNVRWTRIELSGLARSLPQLVPEVTTWVRATTIDDALVGLRADPEFAARVRDWPTVRAGALHDHVLLAGGGVFGMSPPHAATRTVSAARLDDALARVRAARPDVLFAGPADVALPALDDVVGAPPHPQRILLRAPEPIVYVFADASLARANVTVSFVRAPISEPEEALVDLVDAYHGHTFSGTISRAVRESQGLAYKTDARIDRGAAEGDEAYLRVDLTVAPERVTDAITTTLGIMHAELDPARWAAAMTEVEQSYRSERIAMHEAPAWVRSWWRRGARSDPRVAKWGAIQGSPKSGSPRSCASSSPHRRSSRSTATSTTRPYVRSRSSGASSA